LHRAARRGVERSRPLEELLVEARDLVATAPPSSRCSARPSRPTGWTCRATGDLADLMERLSEIAGLARIRFMTRIRAT